MSETAPTASQARPDPEPGAACWYIRGACEEDSAAVAVAIADLLLELGGNPPSLPAMQSAVRALLADDNAGLLLVAEAGGELVGVLAASWQTAIHVPGRYALIQDLWVHPSWRGRTIGRDLLAALCELTGERQICRVEVGLPRESFAGIDATETFYRTNGFVSLGQRMRRLLA